MDQSRGKKILAVDNDPTNLKLLKAILVPEGYTVDTAISGKEVLDRIKLVTPDLILLDVLMPEIDGFQTCKIIRSDSSLNYIPIIFLTAMQIEQKDVIYGLDIGGDDYIKKPFDTYELLSRIQAGIRVKELYDELSTTKAELSRYVSLSTLRMVEKTTSGENIPAGEATDVTVLFSDIRGFTNISENMDPSEVFEMLNFYLSKQIRIVEYHHGIIDKLSGDEIMAIFEGSDMAENALQCGSAIVSTLCDSEHCRMADWVGVGIGINTGPVYVGSIGSETLKDYTVVGNTVNIAARLCGFANKFQTLFTETTKDLLAGKELGYRSVGKISLKGIKAPIEVFELLL